MTSRIFTQTCERLSAGCLFGVCKLVDVTFFKPLFREQMKYPAQCQGENLGIICLGENAKNWKIMAILSSIGRVYNVSVQKKGLCECQKKGYLSISLVKE